MFELVDDDVFESFLFSMGVLNFNSIGFTYQVF